MQVLVWGRQKGVKPVSGIPKNGYPMAYTDIYNKKKKTYTAQIRFRL